MLEKVGSSTSLSRFFHRVWQGDGGSPLPVTISAITSQPRCEMFSSCCVFRSGMLRSTLATLTSPVYSLAWSPDSQQVDTVPQAHRSSLGNMAFWSSWDCLGEVSLGRGGIFYKPSKLAVEFFRITPYYRMVNVLYFLL